MTGSAAAQGWRLSVSPNTVRRGGTLRVRTTSRARTCRLTFHIGGANYRFKIRGRGSDFTMAANSDLGRARVTVRCKGRSRSKAFMIRRAGQHLSPPPGQSAPAPPQRTPITVYNVCHLDPGLGPITFISPIYQGRPAPTAAWTDKAGRLLMFASSTDGDAAVDIAVIPTADGSAVAYWARCNWSQWVNVPQWQVEQSTATAPEAASWSYLTGVMPIDLSPPDLAAIWTQPSAEVQNCPETFDPGSLCQLQPG
jgi:hypothetical protein